MVIFHSYVNVYQRVSWGPILYGKATHFGATASPTWKLGKAGGFSLTARAAMG